MAIANGNIRDLTIQVIYLVNAECTDTMTVFVSPLNASVYLDFVIDDDGAELRSFFFSSRRRHTRCLSDWSSDVCSSDLAAHRGDGEPFRRHRRTHGPWRRSLRL